MSIQIAISFPDFIEATRLFEPTMGRKYKDSQELREFMDARGLDWNRQEVNLYHLGCRAGHVEDGVCRVCGSPMTLEDEEAVAENLFRDNFLVV